MENIREEFVYDQLNRLKTSTTSGLFARVNDYIYDELGNLTSRTSKLGTSTVNDDVGTLSYAPTAANNAGVHAVTSAGGQNYQYDKYGNMTQRGEDTIDYDVFNKPTRIANGSNITTIDYDANHDRFREVNGSTTTYTFAGGLYEEIVEGTKTTQKSYVDGVILNTRVLNSDAEASNDTLYLHTDNLGSVEAISDRLGAFVNRMSFSDWGKRQQSDWKNTMSPLSGFPTQNGYTGHHQLDQHNLVHMGGRVYDPGLGRFLSADLFVQSPYSSQSFNRYSYVANNPLSNVDPSGYCNNPASTLRDGDGNVLPLLCEDDGAEHYDSFHFNDYGGGSFSWEVVGQIQPFADPDFSQQNLYNEADKLYGYAGSQERFKGLFEFDPDAVDEIVITGYRPKEVKNGNGLSLSASGLSFIKRLEGFRSSPYRVGGIGNWTVGYGHEITAAEKNSGIYNNVTEEQASTILSNDVSRKIGDLSRYINSNNPNIQLTQTQKDALISLSFNTGGNLNKFPNLTNNFRAGNLNGVAREMQDITNHGLAGLVIRRQAEATLLLTGNYPR